MKITQLMTLAAGSLLVTGCSPMNFVAEKTSAIQKNAVFPDDSQGDGDIDDDDDGPPPNPHAIPIQNYCSDIQSRSQRSNATTATKLKLVVTQRSWSNGQTEVVCEVSDGIRENILNKKILDLSSCNLPQSDYYLRLTDPDRNSGSLLYTDHTVKEPMHISKNALGQFEAVGAQDGMLYVLVATNPDRATSDGFADPDGIDCDKKASPLVINMTKPGQKNEGIKLSDPINGMLFDILGAIGNYVKEQISSIGNHRYAFITLPDANGNIEGVDQLFGNNTQSADGSFASNGYLALAKYDDNNDGFIDANDKVFSKLRLWFDVDENGRSNARELVTLKKAKVKRLDLQYDASFYERDQYGNESRMKSVAEMEDGSLRLVFDLWFTLTAR